MKFGGVLRCLAVVAVLGGLVFGTAPALALDDAYLRFDRTWKADIFVAPEWDASGVVTLFGANGFALTQEQAQTVIYLESQGLMEESRQYLLEILGIEPLDARQLLQVVGAPTRPSRLIFSEVVMPGVITTAAKRVLETKRSAGDARIFHGALRYAQLEAGRADGELLGCNLGIAKDIDNRTYGLLLPYDHIEYDGIADSDRLGLILFESYRIDLAEEWQAKLTANVQFTHAEIDFANGDSEQINSLGGGLSAGLTYDADRVVASAAMSYQYDKDDVDWADDYHSLFKFGMNAGMRFGEDAAVTVFGIYNHDNTDYSYRSADDAYYDLGIEGGVNLSESWQLNLGYRKVIDLEDVESDELYLSVSSLF